MIISLYFWFFKLKILTMHLFWNVAPMYIYVYMIFSLVVSYASYSLKHVKIVKWKQKRNVCH